MGVICRQDSGVTLFREYSSWCLIWNSTAWMSLQQQKVLKYLSQYLLLPALLERNTKVNPQYTKLYFASEKRSTHTALLQIRRMSVDYRCLVCVHWSWSKLEFWLLSFIFLRLLYVRGDELCQLVPVCYQDLLTGFLAQNSLKICNLLRNFWLKPQYHGSRIFSFQYAIIKLVLSHWFSEDFWHFSNIMLAGSRLINTIKLLLLLLLLSKSLTWDMFVMRK